MGLPGEKRVRIGKLNIDISLTPGDVDLLRTNTPSRSGALRSSMSIVDGNIVSNSPYVLRVEARSHMVARTVEEIAEQLTGRIRSQLKGQKPFKIKKPLGKLIVGI